MRKRRTYKLLRRSWTVKCSKETEISLSQHTVNVRKKGMTLWCPSVPSIAILVPDKPEMCTPGTLIKISSHILNQGLKVNRSLIIKYGDYMWSSIFPSLLTHHCESSQAHSGWELGKFVLIGRLSFVLPSNTKPYNSLSFFLKIDILFIIVLKIGHLNIYVDYWAFWHPSLKYSPKMTAILALLWCWS